MPVQAVDIDRSCLTVIYRIGSKQFADIRDQQVCAAPGITGDGSYLLSNTVVFIESLTEAYLPSCT